MLSQAGGPFEPGHATETPWSRPHGNERARIGMGVLVELIGMSGRCEVEFRFNVQPVWPGFRVSVNAVPCHGSCLRCPPAPGRPAVEVDRTLGLAGFTGLERGDTTMYAARGLAYRVVCFIQRGVTTSWRPVRGNPDNRAVLMASALIRQQLPKSLKIRVARQCLPPVQRWQPCEVLKRLPSSALWRRMVPTDTESTVRHSSACAGAGRRCDGSQVDH
jgi:hypothetical protein